MTELALPGPAEPKPPASHSAGLEKGLQGTPATVPIPMPGTGVSPSLDTNRPDLKTRPRDISQQSSNLAGSPSSLSSTYSGSPAASYTLSHIPSLVKSNSTASAGNFSINSHVSIPVTGVIPYGSLKVVQPPQTPSISSSESLPNPPAKEDLPPRSASTCLENGDAFMILSLPDNFTVGCDTMAISTGKSKFMGLRDLPPGPHFIWVSEPNAISRSGYWFVTKAKGDVRVKQWDRYNEVLGEAASQFEVRNQKENIDSVYPNLVEYRFHGDSSKPPPPPPKDPPKRASMPEPELAYDDAVIWHHLTSSITDAVLERVTGKRGVSEFLVDTSDTVKGEVNFTQASQPFKAALGGTELTFLFPQDAIDLHVLSLADTITTTATKRSPPPTSTSTPPPAPVPDTTPDILAVLNFSATPITEADILAELQWTYITGLHLSNPSCLDQWWHLLLHIVLRAHALALSRPSLCRSLIQTLHAQLVYSDRYIATDAGEGGILEMAAPRKRGRLREALTVYKRRLNEVLLGQAGSLTLEQGKVGHAFVDLEAWFWRFGWDLRSDYVEEKVLDGLVESDEEGEEYKPVVVQLDEKGREVGLVSL